MSVNQEFIFRNHETCVHVSAEPGLMVLVTTIEFLIETSTTCSKDHLHVYCGRGFICCFDHLKLLDLLKNIAFRLDMDVSNLYGSYCGSSGPSNIYSSEAGTLTIFFESDGDTTERGYVLQVIALECRLRNTL